jgi:hypothetical protein
MRLKKELERDIGTLEINVCMSDGVYIDCEITDCDVMHMANGTIATYDKDYAEKEIQRAEKKFGKLADDIKE